MRSLPVMDAINKAGLIDHPYPVKDTLFFKIQGDSGCITSTSKAIQSIVKKHGSKNFKFASTDEEADDLWQNRKYALMSSLAAYPDTRCWTTDVWYVAYVGVSSINSFATIALFVFFDFYLQSPLVHTHHMLPGNTKNTRQRSRVQASTTSLRDQEGPL